MKTQFQHIREILAAVRYPVDPRHESDFRAILLNDKKRRRRTVLLFFLFGVSIVVGGYALNTPNDTIHPRERTILQKSVPQGSSTNNAVLSEQASASTPAQLQSDVLSIDDQNTTRTNQHAQVNPVKVASPYKQKTGAGKIVSNSNNVSRNIASEKRNDLDDNTALIGHSPLRQISIEVAPLGVSSNTASDPVQLAANHSLSDNTQEEYSSNVEQQRPWYSSTQLNSPETELFHFEREVFSLPTIIPVSRMLNGHRFHYGISGGVFPVGRLLTQTTLKTGYGFELGGYTSFQLTSRMQLRVNAGFSKIAGGFKYSKKSETEQYGFVLVEEDHTLEVTELFSGYASTEMGLRRGRSIFCVGLHGQYIYGAQGEIEDVHYSQEASTPWTTKTSDIWLDIKDMPKVSLRGYMGIRTRVMRRVELGAFLHIPIVQTVRVPNDAQLYDYHVYSHGLLPQVTLSYQINAR